nr:reactive intermediate/imine deaminase [Oscillospiraceae bacterium]
MNKEILHSKYAEDSVAPYSQMVKYGNLIFISGQVAEEARGNVSEQTRIILERIGNMLSDIGSDKSKVIKCMIHLSDSKYFDEMNQVYAAYFRNDFPARICTSGAQLWGGLEIEIEAIAGV